MTRLRTALALTLAGLLLALGACSEGDPRPKIAPSETPSSPTGSASASESPGPSEPAMPKAASKRTDAGAEAFVRHWIQVVNFAQASGDTRLLGEISTARKCLACKGYVEEINLCLRQRREG